ncbi:MAG: DinB family protein [Planctomycetes bacterium]|nr:DinB family protein [Planctomycetota bacterium]
MQPRELIERYAGGASAVGEAIAGLSRTELNAFPVPNTWSIQQIVLHLMDSDLIASNRMKRVIAEENPTLIGFDETAFSQRLFYDQLDAAMACDVFRQNRLLTAVILRNLPAEAFSRRGTHNERGPVTLGDLLETYTGHLEHHLKFIREKRRMLVEG